MSILKIFDHEYKELKRFNKIADEIIAKEDEYKALTDDELKNKTNEFKKRLKNANVNLSDVEQFKL